MTGPSRGLPQPPPDRGGLIALFGAIRVIRLIWTRGTAPGSVKKNGLEGLVSIALSDPPGLR